MLWPIKITIKVLSHSFGKFVVYYAVTCAFRKNQNTTNRGDLIS